MTADEIALQLAICRINLARSRQISRGRSAYLVLRGLVLGHYRAAGHVVACEMELLFLRTATRGVLMAGAVQLWRLRRAERREAM